MALTTSVSDRSTKARAKRLLILLLLPLLVSVAIAQTEPSAPQGQAYTEAELDQMLAPIALYPDSLLSQILIAATYPLEVVEAARWSRANPQLKGEAAVRAVDDRRWDPSVKSLVAFPQILQMMDNKLEWTERLGDAFLAQQAQVMDAVQTLRQRAYAAGNLRSNEQLSVQQQDHTIVIEPASPTVVYVPYYDPTVIYGPWWWPAYPPVYWGPWPGYYVSPGFVGFSWGVGIVVGAHFFFGISDWRRHDIRVVDVRPFYYHRAPPPRQVWRHEPEHRRGVPYRDPSVRERFRPPVGSPERRREFRGFPIVPQTRTAPDHRPEIRPGTGSRAPDEHRGAPRVGGETPRANIPAPRPNVPGARPTIPTPRTNVPGPITRPVPESRPHALEGLGRGQEVRRYSERGHASAQPRPPVTNRGQVQQPSGRVTPPSGGARVPGGGTFGGQRGGR